MTVLPASSLLSPVACFAPSKDVPSSVYSAMVINLNASKSNYQILRQKTNGAIVSAVLKADGYGVGAIPVGLALYQEGCRDFFVAYADEAILFRQALIERSIDDARVFVFNGALPGTESSFLEYNLIPVLTDLDQVTRWQLYAKFYGKRLPAALHVDTGMTRTGLPQKEVQTLAETPQLLQGIDINLILSQMVYSHMENHLFSIAQKHRFDEMLKKLPSAPASLAKSGAVFLSSDYHYQMIRPGVALHGVNPTSDSTNPMNPVVSLFARIYQIQEVTKGQSIGYAQTYVSPSLKKIATLTVGYADGYPWALANTGYVLIGGYKAPVVGRVSMDLLTVDVTHVPEHFLYAGNWAQLMGGDITIESIAASAKTVPYEILLGLGKRFHRIYVG